MNFKQRLLYTVYPLLRFIKGFSKKDLRVNDRKAPVSIYDLVIDTPERSIRLSEFKGKKLVIVNIASECGYTRQLQSLNRLAEMNVAIIGFPSNDFKNQEPLEDEEILSFCRLNYGVDFPIAKKSVVASSPGQNVIFRWLTDSAMNGWNDEPPKWNFSKYIINEEGNLVAVSGPATDPLSGRFRKMLGG